MTRRPTIRRSRVNWNAWLARHYRRHPPRTCSWADVSVFRQIYETYIYQVFTAEMDQTESLLSYYR